MSEKPPVILRTESLSKTYSLGQVDVPVLRDLNVSIRSGTFTLVLGYSGCGKSTLLHLLGLLDRPSQGRVFYDGVDAFAQPAAWRDRVRNRRIGFVFQFYHLLPELSVLGNVMLSDMIYFNPLRWLANGGESRRRAERILEQVGLKERMEFPPSRLSGGERQRVAIARALVHDPDIIFADEPTGNLDTRAGWQVFEMLRSLAIDRGKTVVMVTHDNRFTAEAGVVLNLAGGRIVDAETAAKIALEHERKG
jgi:lipoprotein-releasing system ATP-binding protein